MEAENFSRKISKNISKQNGLKDLQVATDIKHSISLELKQKRRNLDRKLLDSKLTGRKEISLLALEKNREIWLNFVVNIQNLHQNNISNVINLC